ncbi:MAG TPA: hypothetical protein VI248_14360, partial [Kineosporiaceae bacterium]
TTGTGVVDAIASLRDATLQWTGGALHDDIALLLLEYRPQEAATLAPDRDRPPCSAERSPPGRRRS